MFKKIIILLLISFWLVGQGYSQYADDSVLENTQKKAAEIHQIASSDTIYTGEEIKALYYQNIEIIELLKQVRNLLQEQIRIEKENKPIITEQ